MTLFDIVRAFDDTTKPLDDFAEKIRTLAEHIETSDEMVDPDVSQILLKHLAPVSERFVTAAENTARLMHALTRTGN
jgi:hypothetical protein